MCPTFCWKVGLLATCLYIISVCFIIRLLPHVGPNHPVDDFHILSLLHILTLTISDENRDKRILNFSFLGWPFSRCWAAGGTCVLCIGSALSSVRLDGYIMGFRLGCRHIRFFFFFWRFPVCTRNHYWFMNIRHWGEICSRSEAVCFFLPSVGVWPFRFFWFRFIFLYFFALDEKGISPWVLSCWHMWKQLDVYRHVLVRL